MKPALGGTGVSLGGGTGGPEQNESERLTLCIRGSGRGIPLLLVLNNDSEDKVDTERRKTRGVDEERVEKLSRVVELGVDDWFIRAGTSFEWGGEEDLRFV